MRRARSTTTRQRASPSTAQQIIWQGACPDGQHLFQLTRSGMVWQLYELNFTGANTASRKMVTTAAMFLEAIGAIGTQYAMLSGMLPRSTSMANRSVVRNAGNAIPEISAQPITNGTTSTNAVGVRRVRRRVSVNRSTSPTAATV